MGKKMFHLEGAVEEREAKNYTFPIRTLKRTIQKIFQTLVTMDGQTYFLTLTKVNVCSCTTRLLEFELRLAHCLMKKNRG